MPGLMHHVLAEVDTIMAGIKKCKATLPREGRGLMGLPSASQVCDEQCSNTQWVSERELLTQRSCMAPLSLTIAHS